MKPRRAMHPAVNAVTGSIAGLAGQIASIFIIANNPELLPIAVAVGAGITGALSGIGNAVRSSENPWVRGLLGWVG